MNETNYVRSDLRFLLPIQPGQIITVLGKAPELVEILNASGLTILNILDDIGNGDDKKSSRWDPDSLQPLPIDTASVDHVIVPLVIHQRTDWIFAELTRIVKPGGWLFLGFHGNLIWHRIGIAPGNLKIQNQAYFSVHDMKALVIENSYRVLNIYGVYKDHYHPHYWVPLENPGAAYHLFDQYVVPRTWQKEILRRLAALMIRIGMQNFVFKDFGLVAQRS